MWSTPQTSEELEICINDILGGTVEEVLCKVKKTFHWMCSGIYGF